MMTIIKTKYSIGDEVYVIDFSRGVVAKGYVSRKLIQVISDEETYVFLDIEDVNSRPIVQQVNENFVFKTKEELKEWVEQIVKQLTIYTSNTNTPVEEILMAITPATIYINVNVIFVESDTKADKGDITSNIPSTGELVLLVMIDIIVVYIYNIFLKSCVILQHFLKSCMILQHLEQNRVSDNPILVKTGDV